MAHFKRLRDRLQAGLTSAMGEQNIRINGHPEKRLPNTLSISFKDMRANELLEKISSDVAASAGAACHADQVRVSSVLEAMRLPIEWAKGTLRFSVGRMTTAKEIDRAVKAIVQAIRH
jgi:cysteine desulfurase